MFSSNREGGAVMHGEFMAFVGDDETIATIQQWAERQGYPTATVQQGGPDMFAQMLEDSAPPKLAIIDIDGQTDPVSTAARLVSLCGEENRIVVTGTANDVRLYRAMLGAGVVDYLVKPLSPEVLNQALAAALRGGGPGKPEAKEAKTVVVIGARGGVGATTIAVNMAWIMAHEMGQNCVLLDLDLQFGTSALSLDLSPGHGLRDIVSSPHRVDGLMIASSIVPESDHFSVLGAEESVDEFVTMDNAAITALLKEMRTNFDYIVIDMPRHLLAAQKRLLTSANEIVLVTEQSLSGIRDTLRIKTALTTLGCPGTITIVSSRSSGGRTAQVDTATFEKSAHCKIDFQIPDDEKNVTLAANKGKAIDFVAKGSPVAKSLRALTEKILGPTAHASKKKQQSNSGLLSSLLGPKPAKPAKKDQQS